MSNGELPSSEWDFSFLDQAGHLEVICCHAWEFLRSVVIESFPHYVNTSINPFDPQEHFANDGILPPFGQPWPNDAFGSLSAEERKNLAEHFSPLPYPQMGDISFDTIVDRYRDEALPPFENQIEWGTGAAALLYLDYRKSNDDLCRDFRTWLVDVRSKAEAEKSGRKPHFADLEALGIYRIVKFHGGTIEAIRTGHYRLKNEDQRDKWDRAKSRAKKKIDEFRQQLRL